jgi:N-acetylglutamate synthase-like GNAT family acetyltransferase
MSLETFSLRQAGKTDWPAIRSLLVINKLPIDSAEAHLSTFVVASSGTNVVGVAGAEVYGQVDL